MKHSLRWTTVVVGSIAAVTLAACSSSSNTSAGTSGPSSSSNTSPTTTGSGPSGASGSPTGSSGGGAVDPAIAQYYQPPTKLAVTTPLTATPKAGLKVIYINQGTPYDQDVIHGLNGGCGVLHWSCSAVSVNPAVPSTIVSAAQSAIQGGANAIIFNVVPAALYKPVLSLAASKHVIVIDLLSGNPPQSGVTQVLPATVLYAAQGKLLGQALLWDAKKRGVTPNVVEVTVPTYASVLKPVGDGYAQATANCADCKHAVLNVSLGDLTSGASPKDIVSYLQAHPGVNYILYDAANQESGVRNAIKAAGLSVPTMFGTAPTPAQFAELNAGADDQYTSAGIQVDGWIVVDSIARQAASEPSDPWATALAPFQIFTKSNVHGLTQAPQSPQNYQELFKALWKVS